MMKQWLIGIGLVAAGVALGIIPTFSVMDGVNDDEVRSAQKDRDAALEERDVARDGIDVAHASTEEAEAASAEAQGEADRRMKQLDRRERKLDKREGSISEAEEIEAQSQFPGDGTFIVGQDMVAGTYRNKGGDAFGCYYAFMAGTGADANIIDNNVTEGRSIVTLSDGEVFESSGCGQWEKTD